MDPLSVLGLEPGASADAVMAAYRRLAKEWHPDRRGGIEAARRMAEINAAYDALRGGTPTEREPEPAAKRRRSAQAGRWLAEHLRRALPPESSAALADGEDVALVARTATWASPEAVLAVTDRRLLWLHDDRPTNRVHAIAYDDVAEVSHTVRRPRRRTATLRVRTKRGRRIEFSELTPEVAAQAAGRVEAVVGGGASG